MTSKSSSTLEEEIEGLQFIHEKGPREKAWNTAIRICLRLIAADHKKAHDRKLAKRVWSIEKMLVDGKHRWGTPEFNEVHLALTTLATELEAAESHSKTEQR